MAIFQTAQYQVKPEAVGKVREAIADFVRWIAKNEPGTRMYDAWQDAEDPTKFCHLFIFEDEHAHARHGESDAVKRFEAVYGPELVCGPVRFTDYVRVAVNRGRRRRTSAVVRRRGSVVVGRRRSSCVVVGRRGSVVVVVETAQSSRRAEKSA